MEYETRVAIEPGANVWMLVSGIVVENDVDYLPESNLRLDSVQKSNEILMTTALHVSADDRTVEDVAANSVVGAVSLVIMCHGPEPTLLQRQARLGTIEGLNLALLVDRQHNGVGRRVNIEPDDVAQLGDEVRSFESLNCRHR